MSSQSFYVPEECSHSVGRLNCDTTGCPMSDANEHYICGSWGAQTLKEKNDEIQKKKAKIRAFNKAVKKIPMIDEYELKGIKNWSLYNQEVVLESYKISSVLGATREGTKLVRAGFDLGYNQEWGVGLFIPDGPRKFKIQAWRCHVESYPLEKATLKECIEWVLDNNEYR